MDRSRKQRPQYPAREGLIISGDPAGRVMERGFAGGRVSRDPADAVAYQAAFVGRATGRYQSPQRRPYEGSPSRRQMQDAPRWSPPRRGPLDFSPEGMHSEESEWNRQKEHWQQKHQSPHGGASMGSRSRESLFSPGPRGGGRGRGHGRGRDSVCEMGEDRFPGDFNEPGNRDRPPEHHPFNEFQEGRSGGWGSHQYSTDQSSLRGPGPSRVRESPVHSRWDVPRHSQSPIRDHGNPRRDHGSPRRDRGSPRRDRGSPRRDRGSPRRDRGSPRRDRGSPRRERSSPRRDRGSPRRERSCLRRDHSSPRRERSSLRRDRGSPRRDRGSPRRDRGSPRRERSSSRRDHGSPRRERSSSRRDPGSPRRERGFETVWGRLGPKYKMSPKAPGIAPSFERHRHSRSPIQDAKRGGQEEPNFDGRRGGREKLDYDPRSIPADRGGPANQSLPLSGPRVENWDGSREVLGDPNPSWSRPRPDQSWGGPHGRVPEGPRVDDKRGTPRPKHSPRPMYSQDGHQGSSRERVDPSHPGNVMANPHSMPGWGGDLHENLGWNAPGPKENMFGLEEQHSGDESDNALSFESAYSGGEPNEDSDGFPEDPNVEDDGAEVDKSFKVRPDGPMPYYEGIVREWAKPISKGEISAAAGKPPKSSKKPAQKKDKTAPKKDMRLFDRSRQIALVLAGSEKRLTKKDAYIIRTSLVEDVQKVVASRNGPELQFLKSGVIGKGWFLITCGNDETVDWLLKWQPPKLGNQTLVVKRRSEVTEFYKIGFWISSVERTVPEILKVLKGQNGRLETKNWKHVGSRRGKHGIFRTFKIDSESLKVLKSYKWNLCFELHTVRVCRLKLPLRKGKGSKGPMKKSTGPGFRESIGPGPSFVPGLNRPPKPAVASGLTGGFSGWGPFQ